MKTKTKTKGLMLLPPPPHKCFACAVEHKLDQPHNAQSLYYQYWFYGQHKRWPTWEDALSHCSKKVKRLWKKQLAKYGVEVKI